jgi:acetyl-CoA acetyltransferase
MRTRSIARQVAIAGVGYSEVSRNSGKSEGELTLEASKLAILDAGLTTADVDGVAAFPHRVSSPFEGPPLPYVQRALGASHWNYYEAVGFGAAQLSSVISATYAIASGAADVVLCYRGHLRNRARFWVSGPLDRTSAGEELAFTAPYGVVGGAPQYAMWAQRYMYSTGTTPDHLAALVTLCRTHAQRNPRAIWRGQPLTTEDYFASPVIASPLRVLDCDMPVDGAVAVVLVAADRVSDIAKKPVFIESIGHATGADPTWDQWADLAQMASVHASRQLWSRTDIRPADVDVAQVYDGFSFLALAWLEDLGFCAKGEAGDFVASGEATFGGTLPICTDGGQLGGGRLHGLGKLAEGVQQLRGECEDRQVDGAETAVVCTGNGTLASTMLLTT